MRVYLDASVLIALLTNDPMTGRADAFFRANVVVPVLSDFASAEFTSALARRVRVGDVTRGEAQAAFSHLDQWAMRTAERIETMPGDVADANDFFEDWT